MMMTWSLNCGNYGNLISDSLVLFGVAVAQKTHKVHTWILLPCCILSFGAFISKTTIPMTWSFFGTEHVIRLTASVFLSFLQISAVLLCLSVRSVMKWTDKARQPDKRQIR